MVDLLYFAWVRESIGIGHERVVPPAEIADVAGLIDWLAARGGGYGEALSDKTRIRAAVDQLFVPLDTPITGAREIALFPPVTGG